jgi:hypothetical protein
MIRIVMLGRLGNNLFQYALGRVLSEKHGVPLVMDGSWFNRESWSQVDCIKRLPGPESGKARVVRRCSLAARMLLKTTGKHYWEYRGLPAWKERAGNHSFDPRFLSVPADCLLFGYFQSPLYFRGFESRLREELLTDGLGLETGREDLAERLRQPGSIAVHVRRTDYTGNPNVELCGLEYYHKAIQRMRDTVENARFHVFSDDPAWCREHLKADDIEVVGHDRPPSALTDLHLMKLASHHIIANSTYSWWAAWLGKKEGQRVLMPGRWFDGIVAPIEEKQLPHWELVG